jgi:hypothetical protein
MADEAVMVHDAPIKVGERFHGWAFLWADDIGHM